MSEVASGPVAIITGAGRGIGRATAMALSRAGYGLVLTSRTAGEVEAVAREAGNAVAVPGDVTDPAHCQRVVEVALERFGRLDALVNNAGYAPVLDVAATTPEQWRGVIDTNLSATFYLARAVWPVFARQHSGVIVNVSSVSARDPAPGLTAYAAAKGGLNTLGLSLAREGAGLGVRVHTVAPSSTETALFRAAFGDGPVPDDQILTPADVAEVIVHCLTGHLRYTSGEVIYVHKSP
jgi:NAD(P)-dependent dehydrogenase (short-subunit alcohol dehydrogenase family)